MDLVVAAVVLVISFTVAAVAIGREARRLDALPPRAVFDVDEAVEYVADHLPDDVTAQLSYDDVRTLLEWNVELLRRKGLAGRTGERVDHTVVISEDEATDHAVRRALDAGLDVTPHQVQQVLAAQMQYLEAISAIGPEADDPAEPGRSGEGGDG